MRKNTVREARENMINDIMERIHGSYMATSKTYANGLKGLHKLAAPELTAIQVMLISGQKPTVSDDELVTVEEKSPVEEREPHKIPDKPKAGRASDKLTMLEYKVLQWIAYNQMNELNGARPENATQTACYCWVDEMADAIGKDQKVVKGVLGSLTNKEFIGTNQVSTDERKTGDEDTIWMTPAGYMAWDEAEKIQKQ